MTGIFSALACTGAPEVFVTACDMPFISDVVINLIKDSYKGTGCRKSLFFTAVPSRCLEFIRIKSET